MFRLVLAVVLWVSVIFSAAAGSARLDRYQIDTGQVSVAGLSSGAFMANQIHVAHSKDVTGAALIAGGLYGCAVIDVSPKGFVLASASQAVGPCSEEPGQLAGTRFYSDIVHTLARNNLVDPPRNLANSKIYLFTGGSDRVVSSGTVEKARQLYLDLGVPRENIVFDQTGPAARAGHSWITKSFGGECNSNAQPYINRCSYDQSGAELAAIYGSNLNPPVTRPSGQLIAFDQTEFVRGSSGANGLSDTGYLFVPKECEVQSCRLQVVLHGCLQSAERIGNLFYTKIGVNEWADSNRIIVLYPQVHATVQGELINPHANQTFEGGNPSGCWNWWGYADDDQYLTKNGVQVQAVWKMIERLEGKN